MKDFKFKIDGKDFTTSVDEQGNGQLTVTVNGKAYQVELPEHVVAARPTIHPMTAQAAAPAAHTPAPAPAAAGASAAVTSPLPGTITKVNVAAGQKVKKGEVLLVMEAMKMANDVVAEADGTVQQVCVKEGQSVNQGDVLIQLQAEAAAAPKAAPAAPKAAPQPAPAAAPAQKPAAGASAVTAPLPGTVTKVLVAVGQQVKAGETVLTMEAMKMENNITAETAGTVKAILVQPGAQVQSGDALVELA
jgi:biotin carboxyl carrier protein